ncbi:hypothetical protein ASG88_17565 [Nocardioides sp. Soil777]|nr:hypothetical protein ASG88_17565 [Nocardioides sp. Soil777]
MWAMCSTMTAMDDVTRMDEVRGIDLLRLNEVGDIRTLKRLMAAKQGVVDAEIELRTAVEVAREAGTSWGDIAVALGTTRSNAYQRFGRRG